jgi:hypothetical protein
LISQTSQRDFRASAAAVEEISVTPVFGMAFMVHMHKRLARGRS